MAFCTSCGKEIAEGAVICKHCGAKLGIPKRPGGVTFLGVISIISGAFGIIESIVSLSNLGFRNFGYILGARVPYELEIMINLAVSVLTLLCGIGFLQLKKIARQVYIYIGSFGILNAILTYPVLLDDVRKSERALLIVIMIVTILITGYILYYVIRRKDYFVN